MSRFANLKSIKKHKFVTLEIEISKLSTADVVEIQEQSREIENNGNDDDNLKLMMTVIRKGVTEMREMTDEELLALPMDDLSLLSAEIMKFSGLGKTQ